MLREEGAVVVVFYSSQIYRRLGHYSLYKGHLSETEVQYSTESGTYMSESARLTVQSSNCACLFAIKEGKNSLKQCPCMAINNI